MLESGKKFHVLSLGCRVNRAEIDEYSAFLISNGWSISDCKNANLIIINTCTVTSIADKKTRQAVRKCCKSNTFEDAVIIVTGCSAALNTNDYLSFDSRIVFVPKKNVLNEISNYIFNVDFKNDIKNYDMEAKILSSDEFRTRVSIKIQDGCDNDCTYCIVHTARGKSCSVPSDVIETKFKSLIEAGVKEVVLTGVNLGAYNYDGITLPDLCRRLISIIDSNYTEYSEGVPARIRLSSIEPQDVSDNLIECIYNSKGKICKHFHLPLQSGSSKVLYEMNRKYDAQYFLDLVKKIRKKMPDFAFSTDIIVGFPGESKSDFDETCNVAKKCRFMKIHVFPYSIRENTPAAERKDQIPHEIKVKRAAKLRNLSNVLAKTDLDSRKNKHEYCLVEDDGIVRSESFHQLRIDLNEKPGSLVNIKL